VETIFAFAEGCGQLTFLLKNGSNEKKQPGSASGRLETAEFADLVFRIGIQDFGTLLKAQYLLAGPGGRICQGNLPRQCGSSRTCLEGTGLPGLESKVRP
jgi:hypothetical protein